MTAMIEARGLTKHYGKTRALDGLDLVAQSGQVVAVLGPNGAGKTTFVRAVATLLRPDEAPCTSPVMTCAAIPRRFAGSSAWPASSPRSNRR
jgi:ABC-type Na+ transport system ATPase subunit NatA